MALSIGYFCAGFILAGFSEVLSPLMCAGLLVLWYRSRQSRYLVVIAGITIGTIIVLLAPGNAIRATTLPPRVDLLTGIRNGLKITGIFLIGQVLDHFPALILAFCIGYLCPPLRRIRRRLLWFEVASLTILACIFFILFSTYYITQGLDSRHFTFASALIVAYAAFIGVLCAEPLPSSQS